MTKKEYDEIYDKIYDEVYDKIVGKTLDERCMEITGHTFDLKSHSGDTNYIREDTFSRFEKELLKRYGELSFDEYYKLRKLQLLETQADMLEEILNKLN